MHAADAALLYMLRNTAVQLKASGCHDSAREEVGVKGGKGCMPPPSPVVYVALYTSSDLP